MSPDKRQSLKQLRAKALCFHDFWLVYAYMCAEMKTRHLSQIFICGNKRQIESLEDFTLIQKKEPLQVEPFKQKNKILR